MMKCHIGLLKYLRLFKVPIPAIGNNSVIRHQFSVCQTTSSLSKEKLEESKLKEVLERYNQLMRKNCFNKSYNKQKIKYVYIAHDEAIDLVIKNISTNLQKETALIIEVNPGLGLLTEALLKAGLPYLRIIEENKVFVSYLKKIAKHYPGQVDIREGDFYSSSQFNNEVRQRNIFSLLNDVNPVKWNDEPPVKIFFNSISNEEHFLRYLIYSLANTKSIYTFGRIEFFIFLPGKEYEYMFAEPKGNLLKYRDITVLYQLLFDIESLGKVKREYFFTFKYRTRKYTNKIFYDPLHFYLIKMKPKVDFVNNFTKDLLVDFIYFVRTFFFKKSAPAISELESYIPDSGPHFIKYGLSIYTRFGDLSPEQILDVFRIFYFLPQYKNSMFRKEAIQFHDEYEDYADNIFKEEE